MIWTMHRAALFPSPVTIAGVRLWPPTVRQWSLLEAIACPYATGGGVGPGDVATVVLICWLPYWIGRRAIRHRWFLRTAAYLLGRRARDTAWEDLHEELHNWLGQCLWQPDRFPREGEKAGLGFPVSTPFSVRLALRCAQRMPLREAWRLSLPMAQLYSVALSENEGGEYITMSEYQELGLPEAVQYLSLAEKLEYQERLKIAPKEKVA
jgi:hypothetical protein